MFALQGPNISPKNFSYITITKNKPVFDFTRIKRRPLFFFLSEPKKDFWVMGERSSSSNSSTYAQIIGPKPKRPKSFRKTKHTLYCISPLPDSILHHILSFLPTEDAIKTSVLSKSWNRLWTFASDLSFYNRRGSKRVRDFVAFVHETLNLQSCVKLDKFLIDFEYSSRYSYNVNKWVRFTTTHKVENLYLEFYGTEKANTSRPSYLLARLLCTNSTLKLLSLRFCKFATKPTICWTSLTVLRISCASLTHDMIQNILLGSPALTELRLYNFVLQGENDFAFQGQNVVINSTSLKKLELDGEEDRAKNYGYATVEISAPNLLFLSISGFMYKRKFQLTNELSLVETKLGFECKSNDYGRNSSYLIYRNDLRELLLKLLHVPKLTISTWCLQVRFLSRLKLRYNAQYLTVSQIPQLNLIM